MGPVHVNPAEAVKAHRDLASRQSVAIHFGTFRMTEEAIDRPVLDLQAALASQGVAEDDFAVLEEGRTRIYILSNNVAAKRAAPQTSLRGLSSSCNRVVHQQVDAYKNCAIVYLDITVA